MSLLWVKVAGSNIPAGWEEVPHEERGAYDDSATVSSRPNHPFSDRMMADTLKQHRYPDEVHEPMYHGTRAELHPGHAIEVGHPGNFVRRMKHVYMTSDPDEAAHYAGPKGHIYHVQPTGPIGHRSDAKGTAHASQWPLEILREIRRSGED